MEPLHLCQSRHDGLLRLMLGYLLLRAGINTLCDIKFRGITLGPDFCQTIARPCAAGKVLQLVCPTKAVVERNGHNAIRFYTNAPEQIAFVADRGTALLCPDCLKGLLCNFCHLLYEG